MSIRPFLLSGIVFDSAATGVNDMSTNLSDANRILEEKTLSHPCYSGGCRNARIHLPVAPACNVSCNYCNRKYDCVNESRPGVTSEVLSPEQAVKRFVNAKSKLPNLRVVGIAGPGDALANFENTKRTLERIREVDPDITFCLSTNGLYLPQYADELAALGVTHVTVTINTVDPEIGARIYREVHYEGQRYTGKAAAALLLANQLEGLKRLADLGIVTKVNTVMIKGLNDSHIEEVVKTVKGYGVYIGNIMQLIPAPGSVFEHRPLTTNKELNDLRKHCAVHLKQMYHCQQCRADAVGELGQDCSVEFRESAGKPGGPGETESPGIRFTAAVASADGRLVNQHFGHALQFRIYRYDNGSVRFLENRSVDNYCKGAAECGDAEELLPGIIRTVEDCEVILVQRIGLFPQKMLEAGGRLVFQTYGVIEEEMEKAAKAFHARNSSREKVV
jgi:MoaA/NifB/PqqE/SkfB family radical SAM enzyme